MAEANLQWETAEVDFENVLLDSGIQGRAGRYGPKVILQYFQAECRYKIFINIC